MPPKKQGNKNIQFYKKDRIKSIFLSKPGIPSSKVREFMEKQGKPVDYSVITKVKNEVNNELIKSGKLIFGKHTELD